MLQSKFSEGDQVRLTAPTEHVDVFDDPHRVLTVARVLHYPRETGPIYALCEDGAAAVTPFRDADLVLACAVGLMLRKRGHA